MGRSRATVSQVLRLVRRHNPARPEEFKARGIRLKKLGAGAFRTVYSIIGLPLVVKFPMPGTDFVVNRRHTKTELGRIKRFKRFRWMRKHLPKVYYSNPVTGVSIIEFVDDSKPMMERGIWGNSQQQRMQGMCNMVQDLIYQLTGTRMTDITDENVRVDQKRCVVKLIDLAY